VDFIEVGTGKERLRLLGHGKAVTEVASSHVPDAVYDQARACFTQKDLADLTFVVVAINGWNRLCVAFRVPPASALPKSGTTTASKA